MTREEKVNRDAVANDRKFFERNPLLHYRIRPASEVEAKTALGFENDGVTVLEFEGVKLHTAVRNITPGSRIRRFLQMPDEWKHDNSEREARKLFENGGVVE